VADLIFDVLNGRGFDLVRASPGWWVLAPTRILLKLGGKAFRGYVPENLAHFEGPDIEISLYPSGAILRGKPEKTGWANGLIAEAVVHSDGLQTIEPRAQSIEREIRRVWMVFDENPAAHQGSRMLLMRHQEIVKEIGELHIDYDEWQILYRQALQLDRALRGEPQLLEEKRQREGSMTDKPKSEHVHIPSSVAPGAPGASTPHDRPAAGLPLGELVGEITGQVSLLVKKQIELAKTELKADIKSEVAMVGGLGISALAAIITVNMLLVTLILALANTMPAWGAGLLVSGFTLLVAVVAGLMGWNKRVKTPMATTRETLKEDIQWTKERLA
jgi:hypothetical protein